MAAAHYKLDNLCDFYLTITDFRLMELTIRLWDLETSLRSLKPSVSNDFEVDGHNIEEIDKAIEAPDIW